MPQGYKLNYICIIHWKAKGRTSFHKIVTVAKYGFEYRPNLLKKFNEFHINDGSRSKEVEYKSEAHLLDKRSLHPQSSCGLNNMLKGLQKQGYCSVLLEILTLFSSFT